MKKFGIDDLDYGPDKGPMETAFDNATQKPKTKREILDAAYSRGYFLDGEFNPNARISDDNLLNEIKDHNDVKYNRHTGKFEDGTGNVYTLKEAAIQNYKNYRKHKQHGFKKTKNANTRSRDLMREQRIYLGWDKKGWMPDTSKSQSVNSGASQEEKIKLANVKNYHSDLNQLSDTAPDNFNLEEYIKKKADEKIKKEDEELKKRFGSKGIAALGDWNI